MRITLVSIVIGALLAGTGNAQQTPARQLPSDVHPQSLTRLPPLTRNDLDDAGKVVYDSIVGDDPPPTTGPVALSLYSPPIAKVFDELSSYLRYNGILSPRHNEVAIVDLSLYAEAEAMFSRRGRVEMVTVIGDYIMVGMVMTAIDQHLAEERPALLPAR